MTLRRIYFTLLTILMVAAFSPPNFIRSFELRLYDQLITYTASGKPDPRIVIVGIDQKSLDQLGRWPWPRDVIGRLVEKLGQFDVAVTALDVSFNSDADKGTADVIDTLGGRMKELGVEKEYPALYGEYLDIRKNLSKDESLATSIRKAGNVVTAFWFGSETNAQEVPDELQLAKRERLAPFILGEPVRDDLSKNTKNKFPVGDVEANIAIIQSAGASAGFLNTHTDIDGTIRTHPVAIEKDGKVYASLPLAAATLYEAKNSEFVEGLSDLIPLYEEEAFQGVEMAEHFLQTDPYGRIMIRYHGKDGTFPIISAADVINAPLDSATFRESLKGKIVFIGATAVGIYDLRVTPFGQMAGVEVQATTTANALSNQTIQKLPLQQLFDVVLPFAIGLLLFFILQRTSVAAGLVLTLALLVALGVFNFWMFAEKMIWLNSVLPAVMIIVGFTTVTVYEFIMEQRSKRFIKDAFGRYLSPKVISQIIDNPSQLKLGGERREMTAFFSDVAGFTSISEKMSPNQLVKLLNKYLSEMSYIIHETDGTVDKYEGDAIIAFWGAPLPEENHAVLCVTAAVRQQRKLSELREEWRRQGKDELMVRMGVNTGPMVVGNMGSRERMDYTMMGDSVNLAARLEGANKYYGSYILASEFTHDSIRNHFLCRKLDTVRVQGKKEPIRLYEVIEELSFATEAQRRLTQFFDQALSTFYSLDFEKASKLFERCDKLRAGGDTACKLYLKRCAELLESPPPDDWDRVYDLAK